MKKGIKIRLYPNKAQTDLINRTFGCSRLVYNTILDAHNKTYEETGKNMNRSDCSKLLTALKKEKTFLSEPDSTALQASYENLLEGFKKMFEEKTGHPKFKRKKTDESYTSKKVPTSSGANIELFEHNLKLPKLGRVRCSKNAYQLVNGHIINRVTVSRTRSGKYMASICYEAECEPKPKTNKTIGFDLGIKSFIITSDIEHQPFENQKFLMKSEAKLIKVQKRLSHLIESHIVEYHVEGDKRYPVYDKPLSECMNIQKQRRKLAKIHGHIANQRYNYAQVLSTWFVNNYDVICCEDLDVKEMLESKENSKSISDCAWSDLVRMLAYKCEWYDKKLVKVDRYFPSSQLCHECGFKNKEVKNLSIRQWTCPNCGVHHDRDINAAINIHNEGIKKIAFC